MGKFKIYFLDDEVPMLNLFAEHFSGPQVQVKTFSDPFLAIEEIKREPPDLLFLDYRMPGLNGEEVAMRIDPRIPKALITGMGKVALNVKFDAIFDKPFSPQAVQDFIDMIMEVRQTSKAN